MIDLKAIRAAAEAAIKKYGGYPVTDPVFVTAMLDRLEAAEAEVLEQARLLGIGGEKELVLMAKLEAAEKDAARYWWITADHADHETRLIASTIGQYIALRGKGATDAAIDAAMKEQK